MTKHHRKQVKGHNTYQHFLRTFVLEFHFHYEIKIDCKLVFVSKHPKKLRGKPQPCHTTAFCNSVHTDKDLAPL